MEFSDFEHGMVETDGGRVHYRIGGRGEPVMLLHGWPQHSLQWHAVAPILAGRYQVLVPDLPGCGGSDLRPDGLYDKATVARAVHQLTAALDLGPMRVAGYDHGAGVAYNYACQDRSSVSHLAVVEMVLQGCGYEGLLQPTPQWRTGSDWQLALFTVPDVAEFAFRGRERELLTWFFWHDACNPAAISPKHLQAYVDQVSKPGALRAGIEYYATVWKDVEINRANLASKLEIPVLGVGGRHGVGEHVGASLGAVSDRVEAVVVDGAGHWIADEQPGRLAEVLLDFFGRT